MKHQKTLVVTLGGTIESFYDPEIATPGDVPLEHSAEKTIIPKAMKKLGLDAHCDFYPLALRDSKKSDKSEFDTLVQHLRTHDYKRVLVIEGTDRMADHGTYLEQKLHEAGLLQGRQILFTGAMNPLRNARREWREPIEQAAAFGPMAPEDQAYMEKNDGWANLRRAMHDLKRGMPEGVFIRMGRGFWPASRMTKEVTVDRNGMAPVVTESGFVALAHPDSARPKITRYLYSQTQKTQSDSGPFCVWLTWIYSLRADAERATVVALASTSGLKRLAAAVDRSRPA